MSVYIKYQENSELLDSLNHVFFFSFQFILATRIQIVFIFCLPKVECYMFSKSLYPVL